MSRSRSWCFTVNNYSKDDEEDLRKLSEKSKYLIFGRESGEEGTAHLQGYVTFKNPKRFGEAKKTINKRAHLEAAKGSAYSNRTYCSKDGDFEEFGTIPQPGKRTDLHRVYAAVKAGATDAELFESHPGAMFKYPKGVENARAAHLASKVVQGFSPVEVLVYWGDAGTGKTKEAHDQFPGLYTLECQNKRAWFDGYTDQETILLDDYAGSFPYTYLLRLLDSYPMRPERKGGHVNKLWKRVIITSNMPPKDWYQWTDFRYPPHQYKNGCHTALLRRIKEIKHFSGLG